MHELRLGRIDSEDGRRVSDVLGDPPIAVPAGPFEVIGRVDERSRKVASGALVRDLGNDQWLVHVLDVAQLSRLVKSELMRVQPDLGMSANDLASFVLGYESKAQQIAEMFAAHGIAPHAKTVRHAVAALSREIGD